MCRRQRKRYVHRPNAVPPAREEPQHSVLGLQVEVEGPHAEVLLLAHRRQRLIHEHLLLE